MLLEKPIEPLVLDLFNRVLIISLKDSLDRQQHVFRTVGNRAFEWVDATAADSAKVREAYDAGRVAPQFPCFRCGLEKCLRATCNNTLIPAQIATWFSHIDAWKRVASIPDVPFVLVLEDDFLQTAYASAPSYISALRLILERHFTGGAKMLRLGRKKSAKSGHIAGLPFADTEITMSNPAYALNQEAARVLLSKVPEVFPHTVDVWLHRIQASNLEALTIHPPPFYELSSSTPEAGLPSLIHPKRPPVFSFIGRGNMRDQLKSWSSWAKHQKSRIDLDYLATGLPRSGSKFMAEVFRAAGQSVGHEKIEKNGISSWMFAADSWEVPYGVGTARFPRLFHFHRVAHYVRHPLEAIPSLVRDFRHSPAVDFIERTLVQQKLIPSLSRSNEWEAATVAYINWNKLVERKFPDAILVQIENPVAGLRRLVPSVSKRQERKIALIPPQNVNKRYSGERKPKPEISAEDFRRVVSSDALSQLSALAEKYGYSIEGP